MSEELIETTERIVAVAPENVIAMFSALNETFGVELPDGRRMIKTIGAHWDDGAHTRIRAASLLDGTITGQPLSDGRVAFRCLWSAALAQAFEGGHIEGAEELTPEQYDAMIVQPEEPE